MARSRPFFFLFLAALASLPALAPAQRLVAWGSNSSGQCTSPYLNSTILGISAGRLHTLALTESSEGDANGYVVAFGSNQYGQSSVPNFLQAVQVAAGGTHSLALRADGTVAAWGLNNNGQCNVPAGLRAYQVAAGGSHSLAVNEFSTVTAWGYNIFGQCDIPGGSVRAIQVAAGTFHSLALRPDGTVVAWGLNTYNQCDVPAGLVATQISTNQVHCLALCPDGGVTAWGNNNEGECDVPAGLVATQVAAGGRHSLALRPDGTVAAWGDNSSGQCTLPAGLTGVIEVSAGGAHSVALVAFAYATVDQKEVYAGDSATGTVKLAFPAPQGGLTIPLSASDARVHVPASVSLPAGATSATFPVTTDAFFGPEATIQISTRYLDGMSGASKGRTVPFALKLKSGKVTASFASSIVGGSTTKGKLTATLDHVAPTDATFQLESGDPAVTLPASITVPSGQKTASVTTLGSSPVSAPYPVTVALKMGDGTTVATANLTLAPIRGSVTLVTPTLNGGESGKGVIYLNAAVAGPLTVPLVSGDPAVSVPSSITMAAGARFATFPITTSPIGANRTVPIMATINGGLFSANLRLLAIPSVRSVTLPASVFGNGRITGTVRLTLSGRPNGTVVQLVSSDPSISVPATVTVPEGQYAATFEAIALDVAAESSATVTGSTPLGAASAGVTVKPLALSGLTLSTSVAPGGSTVMVTVTLNATVATNTSVSLLSDNPGLVSLPPTLTVQAGSRTATVSVTLGSTAVAKNVRITASKHASSLYRTLKVTP